jgi:hypothetical protein
VILFNDLNLNPIPDGADGKKQFVPHSFSSYLAFCRGESTVVKFELALRKMRPKVWTSLQRRASNKLLLFLRDEQCLCFLAFPRWLFARP